MTWTGSFHFLLVLAAFGLAERACRKEPPPRKDQNFNPIFWAMVSGGSMSLVLFAMFCLPFMHEFIWEVRRLWWSSLGALPAAYWGIAAAVGLGMLAGRLCLGRWRDTRWLATLPILCWVHMAHPASELVALESLRTPAWKDGVCMQSTGFTCTPASAATLLKTYGVETDEAEMAERCGTRKSGTHVLGLARGLASKLPEGEFMVRACRLTPDEIFSVDLPCITFTSSNAWVIFRVHPNGTLEVGEALGGRQIRWWSEFSDAFSGEAVLVTPRASASDVLQSSDSQLPEGNTDAPIQSESSFYQKIDASGRTMARFASAPLERLMSESSSEGW